MEVVAQQMVTDMPSSFERSFLDLAGVEMSRQAALECYRTSGLTPRDIDVLEVHDCFSCNEVRPPFFLTCPNSPHPTQRTSGEAPRVFASQLFGFADCSFAQTKSPDLCSILCSDSEGHAFCGMFLKPFKKIAARVLLGLQTQGVAARFLNIS